MPSRPWSRRSFLRAAGGVAATGVLAGCPSELSPTLGTDVPWGAAPSDAAAAALVPPELRPEGVLELYLLGGINPWDTFYSVPTYGHPSAGGEFAGTGWWTFHRGDFSIPEIASECAPDIPLLQYFGDDALGNEVFLGPWLGALRDRPDLLDRMRILDMRHGDFPHPTAHPLAQCGHSFGSPRLAGTAAHVQRYFAERDTTGRTVPWASVLLPRGRDLEFNNADSAAATGLHPSGAAPLVAWIEDPARLAEQLTRPRFGVHREVADELIGLRMKQLHDRLVHPSGAAVRAPVLQDLILGRQTLENTEELRRLFPQESLAVHEASSCYITDLDLTTTQLRLAAELITDPQTPSKYVCVVDSALVQATGGGGYDTHTMHVLESAPSVTHAMRQLASIINRPDEDDPRKIDLDRHSVLLTTEFGRTIRRQSGERFGLDHWPGGYVQVILGGPVDSDRAGIVGAIRENGRAETYLSPAEFRAGLLSGFGIWPFTDESFGLSDVRVGADHRDAALVLRESMWGLCG